MTCLVLEALGFKLKSAQEQPKLPDIQAAEIGNRSPCAALHKMLRPSSFRESPVLSVSCLDMAGRVENTPEPASSLQPPTPGEVEAPGPRGKQGGIGGLNNPLNCCEKVTGGYGLRA